MTRLREAEQLKDDFLRMRKHLILVVDDEPPIQRLVRAKLQADGHAILTAGRGEEALALLADQRPDLIVHDLMMRGIDVFETLRRIRAPSQVPVVMPTARAGDVDKLRGLGGGADDSLTKPFNPDELAARIAAVLRRTAGAAPAGGAPSSATRTRAWRSTWSGGGSRCAARRSAAAAPSGRSSRNWPATPGG